MRLLEYQAKELFAQYGIKTPKGLTSKDFEQGKKDAKELGFPFVIKAQVPVGGRGKAGAIQKCHSDDEFNLKYPQILEMSIKGEKVRAILLEKMAEIKKELYLSLFLNRGKRCYTVIASSEGGVEIESVKNQVIREVGLGNVEKQVAEEVAKEIGLEGNSISDFVDMLQKLSKLTIEKEAELAEINPVAVLDDHSLIALDGKVITDDNSNFRHPELLKYLEQSELEERAEKSGFSLVELNGDIAVVGNGAGLVMSTLDMLSDNGGKPACFLDVGGGATEESVYEALILISKMENVKGGATEESVYEALILISKMENVKGILVNLFGGIVRTTTVASAFIKAFKNKLIDHTVYARLKGAESKESKEMLKDIQQTKLFESVEEAINAAVIGIRKNA
jgi:succinyl-CoA synthetase beta subunit